jgi:hypothetical protein
MRYTLTALALSVLLPAGLSAQTNATKPPVDHTQIVSTNPFGYIFQWYNAEYERKSSPGTTVGGSASYFHDGDLGNVTAFARWYPQGAALDGFYLGARAGAAVFTTYRYEYQAPGPRPANPSVPPTYPVRYEETTVSPAVGLELGYNWLLGAKQNVSVGVGFGLMRTFGDNNSFYSPVLPAIRLVNIGIAF